MNATVLLLGATRSTSNRIESFFRDRGVALEFCQSPEEVLNLANNERPAGLLLNGDRPEALALCARFQQEKRLKGIAIGVFHSDPARPRIVEHCFSEAQADLYLGADLGTKALAALADRFGLDSVLEPKGALAVTEDSTPRIHIQIPVPPVAPDVDRDEILVLEGQISGLREQLQGMAEAALCRQAELEDVQKKSGLALAQVKADALAAQGQQESVWQSQLSAKAAQVKELEQDRDQLESDFMQLGVDQGAKLEGLTASESRLKDQLGAAETRAADARLAIEQATARAEAHEESESRLRTMKKELEGQLLQANADVEIAQAKLHETRVRLEGQLVEQTEGIATEHSIAMAALQEALAVARQEAAESTLQAEEQSAAFAEQTSGLHTAADARAAAQAAEHTLAVAEFKEQLGQELIGAREAADEAGVLFENKEAELGAALTRLQEELSSAEHRAVEATLQAEEQSAAFAEHTSGLHTAADTRAAAQAAEHTLAVAELKEQLTESERELESRESELAAVQLAQSESLQARDASLAESERLHSVLSEVEYARSSLQGSLELIRHEMVGEQEALQDRIAILELEQHNFQQADLESENALKTAEESALGLAAEIESLRSELLESQALQALEKEEAALDRTEHADQIRLLQSDWKTQLVDFQAAAKAQFAVQERLELQLMEEQGGREMDGSVHTQAMSQLREEQSEAIEALRVDADALRQESKDLIGSKAALVAELEGFQAEMRSAAEASQARRSESEAETGERIEALQQEFEEALQFTKTEADERLALANQQAEDRLESVISQAAQDKSKADAEAEAALELVQSEAKEALQAANTVAEATLHAAYTKAEAELDSALADRDQTLSEAHAEALQNLHDTQEKASAAFRSQLATQTAELDRVHSETALQQVALQVEQDNLRGEIAQLEAGNEKALARSQSAHDALEARAESAVQGALESAQALEERSKSFAAERTRLEGELQGAREKSETREQAHLEQQRGLESSLSHALQRAAESEKALGLLQTAKEAAESHAANAESEADSALGEVALAQGEVTRVENELTRLQSEADGAREHVALREQQVEALESQVAEVQKQVDQAGKHLARSESDYGDIFGQYTLQQTDLLNLEIDAKEARQALRSALDRQESLLSVHAKRMHSAESTYSEIVDGLMDLVQASPESSDLIFGLLEKLRSVLDAGQEVVESNRRWVEAESKRP